MKANRKKRKSSLRRCITRIGVYLCILLVIGSLAFSVNYLRSDAHDSESNVTYKSILIKKGDSLWSIANQYADQDRISVNKYMEELRSLNSLSSDSIIAGNYLSVIVYL